MKIQLTITTVLSCLALEASAFWRMPCAGPVSVQMIDPIVNPGAIGKHVHHIQGPDTITANATYEDLLAGTCSSCQVKQDKSAYWVPQLYFKHDNGGFEIVPRIGDMLVYYLQRGDFSVYNDNRDKVLPFPPGFRMVAGDSHRRNFTAKDGDTTQEALAQKAIGYNCLNYNKAAEPSLAHHTWRDDVSSCINGLRVEFFFPSCWNGDLDSPNHMDHMQYPDSVQTGTCPDTHPKRLVSLLYEITWNVVQFNQDKGKFVFSNGDPTGCGFHADFMNGWEDGVLEQAIHQCQDLSGQIDRCKVFELASNEDMMDCKIKHVDYDGDMDGPMDSLPGCNEVQSGPEPATCSNPDYPTKEAPDYPTKEAPVYPTGEAGGTIVTQTHTQYTTVDVYATPEPCPAKLKRHHHHFGHRHKF